MKEFFEVLGMATACTIVFAIIFLACCCVKEGISQLKWRYKYKHRFDKPPTAKCYCVDCKYHSNKNDVCYRFGETTKEYRCTADNWFCWEAEPVEKDKED